MAQTKLNQPTKFQRYRSNKKAQGLKLIRLWVMDTHTPAFRKEVKRQAVLLHRAPEQQEASRFIWEAAAWPKQ
jgi:hypothetical protein